MNIDGHSQAHACTVERCHETTPQELPISHEDRTKRDKFFPFLQGTDNLFPEPTCRNNTDCNDSSSYVSQKLPVTSGRGKNAVNIRDKLWECSETCDSGHISLLTLAIQTISFGGRHNLSRDAVADLLSLIRQVLPSEGQLA